MGRAVAHGRWLIGRFSDPTALTLLPPDARARVEQFHLEPRPQELRAGLAWGYLSRLSQVMAARTVEIDDAIRGATMPQVVILGAGLDGRAWRMPELANSIVYEVDHPDTQGEKMTRVAGLRQTAREVRFVSVDFARDDLNHELDAAGHYAQVATTWVWEGVVMYLTRVQVEATLAVVARRSAPGSRLIVAYHSPAWMLLFAGLIVRRIGEPLRSVYTARQMRALLDHAGFTVVRDEGLPAIAAALSPDLQRATRVVKHLRIVTAEKR